jgi:hypothetical protein
MFLRHPEGNPKTLSLSFRKMTKVQNVILNGAKRSEESIFHQRMDSSHRQKTPGSE